MEIEDFQMFPKFRRTGEEVIGEPMKKVNNSRNGNNGVLVVDGVAAGDNGNRMSRWHHHSSRIIRVSRASGGKDRHSKVWTSKGPRDRRVRLSVSTALQFYDLQDRLGYDQPSKAVEWLIKAASNAIAELPSLNASFPVDDERIASSENLVVENPNQNQNPNLQQTASLSKSACSSNSDTSKNSGLSLSRTELRDKARVRARERTAKEKERESDIVNDNSHSHASFTELLTGSVHAESETGSVNPSRQWMASPAPMEYFSSGLILGSGQTQFPIQTVVSMPFSSMSDQHHHQHPNQEFSFVPDHLISPGGGGAFNLDFNISSSSSAMAGFNGLNRGTLQSNSQNHQSFLGNLQRFPCEGGSGAPFFIGALPAENHHHNNHQFQLYYENGCRNSEHKGKGKD